LPQVFLRFKKKHTGCSIFWMKMNFNLNTKVPTEGRFVRRPSEGAGDGLGRVVGPTPLEQRTGAPAGAGMAAGKLGARDPPCGMMPKAAHVSLNIFHVTQQTCAPPRSNPNIRGDRKTKRGGDRMCTSRRGALKKMRSQQGVGHGN